MSPDRKRGEKNKKNGNKQTPKGEGKKEKACFYYPVNESMQGSSEREKTKNEGGGGGGAGEDFPKMTVWSLSVLTVQSLPPQIKGREVAWLSAALSHVKPRRRPYTCSHK